MSCPQRRLFELFENNQSPLRAIAEKMMADSDVNDVHEVMHERINAVFTNEAMPLADRVRMAGAVGLVMGVLGFAAGKAFFDVPADELQPLLIAALNDVLRVRLTARPGCASPATAQPDPCRATRPMLG